MGNVAWNVKASIHSSQAKLFDVLHFFLPASWLEDYHTSGKISGKENKVEAKSQNPKMIGQATFKFCTFTVFCERMFDHSNQKYIWMYQMLHVTQILKSCPRFEQHSPPCPQLALQEENHICLGTPEIYRNGWFWINLFSSTKEGCKRWKTWSFGLQVPQTRWPAPHWKILVGGVIGS